MGLLRGVCVIAVVAGCVDEPELELDETVQLAARCPDWVCGGGGNSPKIDHMGMHDLSTNTGERNAAGFRLVRVEKGARTYSIKVDGAAISLTDVAGGPALTGASVGGAVLVVVNDFNGVKYQIRLSAVGSATYWGRPNGFAKTTTTYLLEWATYGKPNPEWENICSSPPSDVVGTMDRFHAVVFEGDRISAATKSISQTLQPAWFNIGCAGHALAKLHLNGYTFAAQKQTAADQPVEARFVSNWQERQTFLKMITADYCNSGDAMTIAGQPLEYGDARGYRTLPTLPVEALWNEKGAVCLNTPRIIANKSQASMAVFSNIDADIAAACASAGRAPPPKCLGVTAPAAATPWISTNP